jgi:hypothetical protein
VPSSKETDLSAHSRKDWKLGSHTGTQEKTSTETRIRKGRNEDQERQITEHDCPRTCYGIHIIQALSWRSPVKHSSDISQSGWSSTVKFAAALVMSVPYHHRTLHITSHPSRCKEKNAQALIPKGALFVWALI